MIFFKFWYTIFLILLVHDRLNLFTRSFTFFTQSFTFGYSNSNDFFFKIFYTWSFIFFTRSFTFRHSNLNNFFFKILYTQLKSNVRDNQLILQLILKLITFITTWGAAGENNTQYFGNPVRPMLPTCGGLRIALMSNFY